MNPLKWIITYGCKLGMHCVLKIDSRDMTKIRREGPLILFINHSGKIEAPVVYTELAPRPKVTALGKIELFKGIMGFIMRVWEIIPVTRGESDLEALRTCVAKLKDGWILGIAPEGTRNQNGELRQAQGGIALLALHSGAPIQPMAQWGAMDILANLKRFRRARMSIRVGPAFRLDTKGNKLTREIRQEMADEMMYQLALLMPEELRGAYADLGKLTTRWLTFEEEAAS
ncbi:MAG: lysophospholipid acyltransferase family protein [Spirochaetota bacterium]